MDIKTFLFLYFTTYGVFSFLEDMYYRFIWKESDEENFWESHPFQNSSEKADDLCEIGYTSQRNEIIYKKYLKRSGLLKY